MARGFITKKENRMFVLSDSIYSKLKWICLIFLPAVATLYFSLAQVWGFPYAEQILGTIAAVETFIGTLIGISHVNYYKDLDNGDSDEI